MQQSKPKPVITVLSTFSKDTFIDDQGSIIKVAEGGPAKFIAEAISNADGRYNLKTANKVDVEILLNDQGEFGRIDQSKLTLHKPKKLDDWTIISTILNEWDISGATLPAHTCIDVQGYVRDGTNFGSKKNWTDISATEPYLIKGTAEEVAYLDKKFVESQKKRLLIVTNGSQPVDLYHHGKQEQIPVRKISSLSDTVGAGDTFMGSLVVALSSGKDPQSAVRFANEQTAAFLISKRT